MFLDTIDVVFIMPFFKSISLNFAMNYYAVMNQNS